MKPSVYIETTMPSYLVARPSRDVVLAGHQQVTHDWWQKSRPDHQLYISDHAKTDAYHIAVAAVHGVDFLLTWN